MSSLRYFIVDVFAEVKYAGNQLAVFVDSGDLPDSIKQQIAKETNYSETIADIDLHFPIQQASTGIPFVIVPVKTLAAVKRAQPRWDQYVERTNGTLPRLILIFAKETYSPENDSNVRVFVDEVAVSEDRATGSGNAALRATLWDTAISASQTLTSGGSKVMGLVDPRSGCCEPPIRGAISK